MASFLKTQPYPWHEPDAQQLHITLSQLHPTSQTAMLAAQRTGIDVSVIYVQQAPAFVWKEILDAAANDGLMRNLVQDVRDRLNPSSPLRPFFDDLLAERSPRAMRGSW